MKRNPVFLVFLLSSLFVFANTRSGEDCPSKEELEVRGEVDVLLLGLSENTARALIRVDSRVCTMTNIDKDTIAAMENAVRKGGPVTVSGKAWCYTPTDSCTGIVWEK